MYTVAKQGHSVVHLVSIRASQVLDSAFLLFTKKLMYDEICILYAFDRTDFRLFRFSG